MQFSCAYTLKEKQTNEYDDENLKQTKKSILNNKITFSKYDSESKLI